MCRYCACELSKKELSEKCSFKKFDKNHEVPWHEDKSNISQYEPSNCFQPKESNGLPVIIQGSHVNNFNSRVLCPMYWTFVPSWFKEDVSAWSATTYNARIENLEESKVYSPFLAEGQRCIIIMEGFYEIKKKTSSDDEIWYLKSSDKSVLKAAGIFSIKKEKDKKLFTCTVVTTEANSNLRKVHTRMPVFLKNEDIIEEWLDYKNIKSNLAVEKIKKHSHLDLEYFQTSKIGSNKPINLKNSQASKNLMQNWLSGSRKRKSENL